MVAVPIGMACRVGVSAPGFAPEVKSVSASGVELAFELQPPAGVTVQFAESPVTPSLVMLRCDQGFRQLLPARVEPGAAHFSDLQAGSYVVCDRRFLPLAQGLGAELPDATGVAGVALRVDVHQGTSRSLAWSLSPPDAVVSGEIRVPRGFPTPELLEIRLDGLASSRGVQVAIGSDGRFGAPRLPAGAYEFRLVLRRNQSFVPWRQTVSVAGGAMSLDIYAEWARCRLESPRDDRMRSLLAYTNDDVLVATQGPAESDMVLDLNPDEYVLRVVRWDAIDRPQREFGTRMVLPIGETRLVLR
jgi:hypothetical protein